MITLSILFAILYIISCYDYYKNDYEMIYMNDFLSLVFFGVNIFLTAIALTLILVYLP
jgi:hypothetical protein